MPVYNFSAGPAVLADSVLNQIQSELHSVNGSGMSILEISHRSALFDDILNETTANLRRVMGIPDNYEVLFMQGGGTGQFSAVPLNLAAKNKKIALLDSGQWALKAGQEATKLGFDVDTLATTKDTKYQQLPTSDKVLTDDEYNYLHIVTNNTIEGTAFHQLPAHGTTKLVADMSSNFLAEEYDVNDFDLIFGGAQKNLGTAGVTIVIVKKDLLGKANNLIPATMDYNLFAKKNSMPNTPPTFSIYVCGLVIKWIESMGGVKGIHEHNVIKANRLYNFLDESKLFNNFVSPQERSLTNIPFTTGNEALDAQLVTAAADNGLMNLKGHRSVGGLRASLYNAMPLAGADALVEFLHQFEKQNR